MSLFQTHAWQSAWWETWGVDNDFTKVSPWSEGRCGLYLSSYRVKGIIPLRSLEFVGSSYRNVRSVRTEYNTLCSELKTDAENFAAFTDLLKQTRWSEAVFNDLIVGSQDIDFLYALARSERWLVRETASDTAWSVDTNGDFGEYLRSLGSNTRLRIYNRRRVLESLGSVDHENLWLKGDEGVRRFFDELNQFHCRRWGKPVFREKALQFHRRFLERVTEEGGLPQLLLLYCDDAVISVLYNVVYKGRVYNIQSGFEEAFHKKLSLGFLHLGYAIEFAFEDPQVRVFDMLAGRGKNNNYKKHLATSRQDLLSLMVVRSRVLNALYRVKDR
ncbi:GNAT family N-acetyltransferase [Marinobacter fonticola]|uniref:GNAT family N-acetyltransferase n=1 Tax=Marinobacter fonticola TaxID=2603215 RepID=UPI0011E8417A|nr:GNAT family N-acetyltransferase [Marinobacter fonticola]